MKYARYIYHFMIFVFIFIISNCNLFVLAYSNTNELYSANTWAEFARNNTIGNEQGIEVHIKNQNDLNNYLKRTGNDLSGDLLWLDNEENITFPQGKYIFNAYTDIYCPEATGDVDFNGSYFLIGNKGFARISMVQNQHNRTFKNLNVIGSTNFEIDDTSASIKIINQAAFFVQAVKASNAKFKNMEFNNNHRVGMHVFDIMGCNNFVFENITERGYLENYSDEKIEAAFNNSNGHFLYSELIQIDSSASGGLSLKKSSHKSEDFRNNYFDEDELFDGAATTNVTMNNIRLVGYSGRTGDAIINNTSTTAIKPFPSSLGNHGGANSYTGISISNSYFENHKHVNNQNSWTFAPIHFRTTGNVSITISNNTFINCYNGYQSSDGIQYTTDFDSVVKNVTSTVLTANNNTIKTYNGYSPEEPIYNNYIYLSSNYNAQTGVLTRSYRSPISKIFTNNINLNAKNETINNTSNYTLLSSTVTSQTTEQLTSGDSIIVKYITNKYKLDMSKICSSNKLKYINNIVYGLDIGSKVSYLKENCTNVNVTSKNYANIGDNNILKTGYVMQVNDEETYNIAVAGDILGTGELSLDGISSAARHILDKNVLNDEYLLAADYNADGKVKINDIVKMLKNI